MIDLDEMIEKIRSFTSEAARYELLAEEAAELAQAASKCARILRGEVPTPKSLEGAKSHVVQELTDVMVVSDVIGVSTSKNIYAWKLQRWICRHDEPV